MFSLPNYCAFVHFNFCNEDTSLIRTLSSGPMMSRLKEDGVLRDDSQYWVGTCWCDVHDQKFPAELSLLASFLGSSPSAHIRPLTLQELKIQSLISLLRLKCICAMSFCLHELLSSCCQGLNACVNDIIVYDVRGDILPDSQMHVVHQ